MSVLPQLETLPEDILNSRRGVAWKFETRDGKVTKVPYQARRPQVRADVTDPAHWCAFMDAYDAVADGKVDGAGFVLGNGIVGIDLDHCRDPETGTITDEAQAIVRHVDSYTERSQSNTGLHILAGGILPPGGRRKGSIELYAEQRYFVVTGRHVAGTPTTIEQRTAQLARLHAQVFGPAPTSTSSTPLAKAGLDDTTILVKAAAAKNGARFAALWSGDLSAFNGDQSAADLALLNILAFWTGRDRDQMDRLFRQSGLLRPKWDSRRGTSTYGIDSIEKAIVDCRTVYTPEIVIELDDEADPRAITNEAPRASTSKASTLDTVPEVIRSDRWPTLHDDALIGVFGDLVRTIAPATEADPVALLGHCLVFWGSLIGRSAHARVNSIAHFTNENVLLIGATSGGRKGTAEGEIRPLMAAIDPTWASTRLMNGLSTGEGLIHQVRDPITAQGEVTDDGVTDKRLCVVESEFGKVLRVVDRSGNTLSATMRQAWDGGTLAVMTRNSPVRATGTHISLIAHITPQELREQLKHVDMANGFANRFLLLLVRRSQFLPDGGLVDGARLATVLERLTTAADTARLAGYLTRDRAAAEYWAGQYRTIDAERPGLVGALCTRAAAHILRVSLLYALADSAAAIRIEHVKAAVALWQYSEASIRMVFRQQTGHQLADYLLALLEGHPEGLTRTSLSTVLGNNRRADEIHAALQRLLDYGLAHAVAEPTTARGGRPATRWFASTVATKETK